MSTKMTKLVLAIGAMAMAGGAMAAEANTATGHASAAVLNPISIAEDATQHLNFGKVYGNVAGGTVILTAAATTVVSGTASQVATSGTSSGKFTVSGETGLAYTFTQPGTVSLLGPSSATMSATLTSSVTTTGELTGGAEYLTVGTQAVYVGGTLTVGVSQAPGAYAGTYSVSVAYN
jgi:hypothetical protein